MKFSEALQNLKEDFKKGTFKCPICGTKVSKNSKYCLVCKKKVDDPDSKDE